MILFAKFTLDSERNVTLICCAKTFQERDTKDGIT
jgi:hypothetical protein